MRGSNVHRGGPQAMKGLAGGVEGIVGPPVAPPGR
jgi:hypothetical protein